MAGSTIAAFKNALVTALQARPGLANILVDYAENPTLARREYIYLGAVQNGDQTDPVMRAGRIKREENYVVHVMVRVLGNPTPYDNEVRALALAQEVEEYLADTPQPTASVMWALVSGMAVDTVEQPTDGPDTLVDISVSVKARLL
jgi:hypothetical protein